MAEATDKIEMSWICDAKPKVVFDAWLSSEGHAGMTGGGAVIEAVERGAFTAWDGYIFGKTTKIDKRARRLVQTWRTFDFAKKAPDSKIDVTFRAHKGKTQVLLKHTRLMPGDGAKYTVGWYQHYIEPMQRYFGD